MDKKLPDNLIVKFSTEMKRLVFMAMVGMRDVIIVDSLTIHIPNTEYNKKFIDQKKDDIVSFVDAELIVCPACNGSGKYDCVSRLWTPGVGFVDQPPVRMDCQKCYGHGKVDPIIEEEKKKAWDAFWCSCERSSGSEYVDDNTAGAMCSKHHYICNDCGKVTQTGQYGI